MLTLKDINEVSFRKASFSGYKPEDVEDFIESVSDSFKELSEQNKDYKSRVIELTNKNSEILTKLRLLTQKVESYKIDEDGIKNALLSAQKVAEVSVKEAKNESENLINEAKTKAYNIIEEAKAKSINLISEYDVKIKTKQDEYNELIREKEKEFFEIKSQVTDFRKSLKTMYKLHLNDIEQIPDYADELGKMKAFQDLKSQSKITNVNSTESNNIESSSVSEDTIVVPEIPKENIKSNSDFDDIGFNQDDVFNSNKNPNLFDTLEFDEKIDLKNK